MTLTEFVPSLISRFPTKHRFAIITCHYLDLSCMFQAHEADGRIKNANKIDDWFIHVQEPIDYPKEALNFLKDIERFPKEQEGWDVGTSYLLHVSVALFSGGKISAAHHVAEATASRTRSLRGRGPMLDYHMQVDEMHAKFIEEVTELMIAKKPVPDPDKFYAGLSHWVDTEEFMMFDAFLAVTAVCEYMEKFHGLDLSDKKILPDSPTYKAIFARIARQAGGAEWVVGRRKAALGVGSRG